jgi:hypothetical protein
MRAADHSARGRFGRVLPGPRSRIAAVATGLGLILLQPGAPAADTNLFKVTPAGESPVLTVGEPMELEATPPTADPAATYSYAWYLDEDPEADEFTPTVTATVKADPGTAAPYHRTIRLVMVDQATLQPYDSEPQTFEVGHAPVASFVLSAPTTQPRAGTTVTFTSTASDQDGDLDESSRRWYVDGEQAGPGACSARASRRTATTRSSTASGTPRAASGPPRGR